ncbi:unnamed protein product [Trichogramma brassicae]|uniref:Uncharacterized protein n=1 Tax=Trichogramma brassicae TaxID=86971 RepID=A0A6H5HVB7_9HYME|nr:unnamed protein product [Trichogramma brassicae]
MGESPGIGHFQSGNVIIPGYIRFLSLFLSLRQIEKGTNKGGGGGGGGRGRGRDCCKLRRIAILNINYKNRVCINITIAESQQQRDLKISTACVRAASSLTHAESASCWSLSHCRVIRSARWLLLLLLAYITHTACDRHADNNNSHKRVALLLLLLLVEQHRKIARRSLYVYNNTRTILKYSRTNSSYAAYVCTRVQEVGNVEQSDDRALRNIMDSRSRRRRRLAEAATAAAAATAATAAALAAAEKKKPAGGEKREEAILIPAWIRAGESNEISVAHLVRETTTMCVLRKTEHSTRYAAKEARCVVYRLAKRDNTMQTTENDNERQRETLSGFVRRTSSRFAVWLRSESHELHGQAIRKSRAVVVRSSRRWRRRRRERERASRREAAATAAAAAAHESRADSRVGAAIGVTEADSPMLLDARARRRWQPHAHTYVPADTLCKDPISPLLLLLLHSSLQMHPYMRAAATQLRVFGYVHAIVVSCLPRQRTSLLDCVSSRAGRRGRCCRSFHGGHRTLSSSSTRNHAIADCLWNTEIRQLNFLIVS